MTATVETPTTIRELTRYVEHEYPDLSTSFNPRCEKIIVVARPGQPEPPAPLREVLGAEPFELRAHAVARRSRWVGVVTAADTGGPP